VSIIESVFLGLIQGLTEFIPVSSSGHLVIAQYFFSGESEHMFLQWIDIGTFLALVVYFRHRLVGIFKDIFIRRNYRLARNIFVTALPAGLVGLFLSKFIESNAFFGNIVTVLVGLAVIGVIMIVLEKLPKLSVVKAADKLPTKRAFIIGLVQVFALIPGVSRSGSTIIAGRLMGLDAAKAAEYSFLVSLPIMGGLILKLLVTASDRQYFIENTQALIIGNIAAFIAGLLAVSFLINYLSKHGLALFGWYRVGLASVIAAVLLVQSLVK
jgi:undecaprenyl-diphosphatase